MTIAEIEQLDSDFLTVAEVAGCIHCAPQLIRDEAEKDAKVLGFPVAKIGHSYKIPREGFLNWAKGRIPVVQVVQASGFCPPRFDAKLIAWQARYGFAR